MISLERAKELVEQKQYAEAEQVYLGILNQDVPMDEKKKDEREKAILAMGDMYVEQGDKAKLREFIPHSTEYMMQFAKSKTAKVLKTLIEKFSLVPNSLEDLKYI